MKKIFFINHPKRYLHVIWFIYNVVNVADQNVIVNLVFLKS